MKPSPAAMKLAEKILAQVAHCPELEIIATLIDASNKDLVEAMEYIQEEVGTFDEVESALANHQPEK